MSLSLQEQFLAMVFKVAYSMTGKKYVVHTHNHICGIFVCCLLGEVKALHAIKHQTLKQVCLHTLMYLAQIASLEVVQYGLGIGNGVFYALHLIFVSALFVVVVGYGKTCGIIVLLRDDA